MSIFPKAVICFFNPCCYNGMLCGADPLKQIGELFCKLLVFV